MGTLFIIIPLSLVLVLNLPFMRIRVMKRFAPALVVLYLIMQTTAAALGLTGSLPSMGTILSAFLAFSVTLDALGMLVLGIIGIVSLASLTTAFRMIPDIDDRHYFINLLLVTVTGLNGITMLTDLFSLYVFLEVTAVASFIMIASEKDAEGLEGSFKYLLLSALATAALLSGIALLMLVAPDTSFASVRAALQSSKMGFYLKLGIVLFLFGLFIKGGLFPFHWWLPDAYTAAPAPVSVMLAGIVTKVSGIYSLIRVVTAVFAYDDAMKVLLTVLGCLSILAGALLALGQSDLKRMLAYSSVSQVGYIILGLGCGTPLGVAGAVFHFFNHAVFKSLLFVNAAALEDRLGTRDMTRMGGLQSRMPVTGATSLIAFLSAAGIPPMAGFWSKLIIVIALWQAGFYAAAVVAVLASLLTMAYFLSIQRQVFFGTLKANLANVTEAGPALLVPALVLAAITVGVGFCIRPVFDSIILPLGTLLVR